MAIGCFFAKKARLMWWSMESHQLPFLRGYSSLSFSRFYFCYSVLFLGCMWGICSLFLYLLFLSCISISLKVLISFFIITLSLFVIYIFVADKTKITSFRHTSDRVLIHDFLLNYNIS